MPNVSRGTFTDAEIRRWGALQCFKKGGPVTGQRLESELPKRTLNELRDAIITALNAHLEMPLPARRANGKAAAVRVAAATGFQANGQPKKLLSTNIKLQKARRGYELNDEDTIKLADGSGVETTGLAMSPALAYRGIQTCPNHLSSHKACLGKTSNGNFIYGAGADLSAMKGPRLAGLNKTRAFLDDPGAFAVRLHDEIEAQKKLAAKRGNRLGVRLNVLSDIHPKVWQPLMEAHPDVHFYDYTKNDTQPVAPNHHLTFSSTGVSQPGVVNPHQNWKLARRKMEQGMNVAMPFSNTKALPSHVHDVETGRMIPVIDGDQHDFRPLDKQAGTGVIIGLRKKAVTHKEADAHITSGGFFVHHDPQFKREGKKLARDANGQPIPTNFVVRIQPQGRSPINLSNEVKK